MGIDLITWRTRIGLNYYNACRPLQTSCRIRVYHPKVGVEEVMNNTPLVLKGFALSLMLHCIVCGWFRLKGRGGSGKICCHWWGSTFNMKETVSSEGIKLLRVVVVVMSLLLVMAGDVETNPGPRKKEGSALTLKAAVNALHSVCPKWYKIGVQLDVPSFQLTNIEKKSSDSMERLCDTLDYWMSKETSCSWRYLVDALKAPFVDEIKLAKEIEEKHCGPEEERSGDEVETSVYQQEVLNQDSTTALEGALSHTPTSESHTASSAKHSSTCCTPPSEVSQKPPFGCGCGKCTFFSFIERGCPMPIPSASSFPHLDLSRLTHEQQEILRGRLQFESQKIMMQFQELVSKTIKSLIRQNVSLDELVSHVMTLGAFNPVFKQLQVPLFQYYFRELKTADTIPKIFLVLKDYFSFFNYDIIEHIIKVLGTEEDKANLQRYKSNFEQYSKRRIFECLPYFGPMSERDHADIFVKLDSQYENYTVLEIKGFCNTLSEILHLSSQGVLRLCRVEKGCIQLIFQVPSVVQQEIFPLSRKQEEILNAKGVIKLTCADYQFPHENSADNSADKCNFDTDAANGNEVEGLEQMERKLHLDIDEDPDRPVEELEVCEPVRKKPRLDIDSDSAMGFSIFTDGKSTTLSLSEDPLDRAIDELDEPRLQSLAEAASNWNTLEHQLAAKKGQMQKFVVEENPMLESDNGITAVHVAANAGNLEELRYFISEENCNPACPGPLGLTPLHLASEKGHLDVVKYLVSEQQIDPLCEDEYGNTPLHGACAGGHQAVVEVLASELTKYAPLSELMSDLKNVWNVTPLHSAIPIGHLGIVQFFISDVKCDPNVPEGWYCRTPLHTAAECGHLNIVKFLTDEQSCNPSCLDDLKSTPLHYAALMGHLDTVRFLALEKHCDPMCTNYMQNTPLHLSVQDGHADIVKFLTLEMHCDPSNRNANNVSALHLAVAKGHFDIVRFFISDLNCDPNVPGGQFGRTPLHTAAECGYVNIVKYLTDEQGCNPSCLDDLKYTPLHLAVAKGHLDIARFFISDRNCDPNVPGGQYGRTLLHTAAECGHLHILKYLIDEQGCSSSCVDDMKLTPLHCSAAMGHMDVVKFLTVQKHCDPMCKNYMQNTPLHMASPNGHIDIVKFLTLEMECDPKSTNADNITAIHLAVTKGYLDILQFFISDLNCDPNVPGGQYGRTPLHTAAECGYLDMVKYLTGEQGCNPSCLDDLKYTPLHLAVVKGHLDIARFLISYKNCDPSISGGLHGKTPLHSAAKFGHLHIVKYLTVEQGCNPVCLDHLKRTPLHYAAMKGHFDIVKFLTLVKHCDTMCRDCDQNTPLHLAALSGNIKIVKFFIEELKCSPYLTGNQNMTPLEMATAEGHTEVAMYLTQTHLY